MAVILIDLDRHVPGHVLADFADFHDAGDYLKALNANLPHAEDDSFGNIEISGDRPGGRKILRVYGKVVDREAVAAILDAE